MKQWRRKKVVAALAVFAALPLVYMTCAFAQRQLTRPRHAAATQTRSKTITVKAGGDLQAALNRAVPGDEVVLEAGAAYVGNFTLPVRAASSDYVTVRSSRLSELPAGRRVTASDAGRMARVATPNIGPALVAPPGSSHYRFLGLEFTQASTVGAYSYSIVELGDGNAPGPQDTAAKAPHHLDFDRCLVRARDDRTAAHRGIALNSAHTRVTNSHISGIKWAGNETQALAGWNGPGPFLIENNYLEAAGINVLFGGAVPATPGLIASDITVRGNHLTKLLSWRSGDPSYAGTPWTVKNLLELKSARRVVIEGNVMEHAWAHAQTGWAVIMNTGNDSGSWSRIEDVEFRNNVIRGAGNGINLRGRDEASGVKMARVRVANNLLTDLGPRWGGYGVAFQVLRGPADVSIDHNTALQEGSTIVFDWEEGEHCTGLRFTNNVVRHNVYGVFGSGGSLGTAALEHFCRRWAFAGNVVAGAEPARYPAGNFYPPALDARFFVDAARGNYRIADPRFKGRATDGKDPGCDFDALESALARPLGPSAGGE